MDFLEVELFSTVICISLFVGVKNSGEIRDELVRASKSGDRSDQARLDWAFIDASMITSMEHILTSIYQVLISSSNDELKTKTLHSEILWALSPGTNIMDAIKRFGIGPKTSSVLLIKLLNKQKLVNFDQEALEKESQELVQGNQVSVGRIGSDDIVNWKEVRRVYKLNEDPIVKSLNKPSFDGSDSSLDELQSKLNQIIVATVALKSVAG
ncbi:kinase binding protein CGI-121-domain-containing protein [Phakopsora pachyrhizi]|uniref:EKC/KEOPS complex subunit CGI121 n=1 Tax=Phakopsora pachyrhizi TaxID=170000 RepID=A0AAV0BNT6_PHAPC|nr:kinase binding protein CGI-121-domain-containing protein [Phakopsora pachyrhizi]CAH7687225.1 kinase binding protein CGI-121-domain-containing protein [Phakopsora pachyrhizi]